MQASFRLPAIAAGVTAAALSLGAINVQAAWPDRPITIVVPTAPGGGNDAFARVIAQKMGDSLKQSVVVVNKAGAQAQRGDFPNALATTQALTNRFPDWSIGYNLQASLLDALDREEQALAAYGKAVAAKPASALILTNMGNLQRRLGRLSDARSSYEAALRLQPGYPLAESELNSMPK
ncbi:MAG: tetratricopeptide repeat protein [Microbacterium sp.]|nr:tetratricopeptide repeat protein [Microbacterium sp.]